MKLSFTNFIIILLTGFVIGILVQLVNNKTINELESHKEYYNKTEELLDSICIADSAFIKLTETDVYSEYLEARNKIRVE